VPLVTRDGSAVTSTFLFTLKPGGGSADGEPTVNQRPTVYGTPEQFARLLDSIAGLADREPVETFVDSEVRSSAVELTRLLNVRLGEATSEYDRREAI
jgi:hypothetical protein